MHIVAGPDGNLWFTSSYTNNQIGRITPAGVITVFALPTPQSSPQDIIAGPDGNLWFTELGVNRLGRITPAGVITEFALLTSGVIVGPLTVGPNGTIWLCGDY